VYGVVLQNGMWVVGRSFEKGEQASPARLAGCNFNYLSTDSAFTIIQTDSDTSLLITMVHAGTGTGGCTPDDHGSKHRRIFWCDRSARAQCVVSEDRWA
jgi:hypothetical protein